MLTGDIEHLASLSFPVTLWTQRHFVRLLEGRSPRRASRGKNFGLTPKPIRSEGSQIIQLHPIACLALSQVTFGQLASHSWILEIV